MPKCIYCLETHSQDSFEKREHIVPRQLGSFVASRKEDPITLLQVVCDGCNSYFGDTMELALGRNSIEALYRLEYGQKPLKRFHGFDGERVKFRVPKDMPAAGVILTLVPHPEGKEELVVVPPPQAGIMRTDESTYRYFTV
jgi:hypothetical protein